VRVSISSSITKLGLRASRCSNPQEYPAHWLGLIPANLGARAKQKQKSTYPDE